MNRIDLAAIGAMAADGYSVSRIAALLHVRPSRIRAALQEAGVQITRPCRGCGKSIPVTQGGPQWCSPGCRTKPEPTLFCQECKRALPADEFYADNGTSRRGRGGKARSCRQCRHEAWARWYYAKKRRD